MYEAGNVAAKCLLAAMVGSWVGILVVFVMDVVASLHGNPTHILHDYTFTGV